MSLLKNLFGGKPKTAPKKAGALPVKDSARAKLIAEAQRIQRSQGSAVRQTLTQAISDLGKAGPKLLKDPDALTRLVSLIQTRQTLNGLATGEAKPGPAPVKSRGPRR